MRHLFPNLRNRPEKYTEHWHTKLYRKIDEEIMATIDPIIGIFVDREKRMTKFLRHSEKSIRTIAEEKMKKIMS